MGIVVSIIFWGRAINNNLLTELSKIAEAQEKGTKKTKEAAKSQQQRLAELPREKCKPSEAQGAGILANSWTVYSAITRQVKTGTHLGNGQRVIPYAAVVSFNRESVIGADGGSISVCYYL